MTSKKNYGKITIALIVMLMIGKLLGLFRDSYIASVYGSSSMTDVFFLVNTTITLMAGLISQAINTCAIPILSEIKADPNRDKLNYVNNLLHVISACSVILIICILIFINPITSLLAPGFDDTQLILMKQLIYIGLPCLIFYSIVGVRRAYLQSEGSFVESGITDLVLNITYVLALIFISEKYGIYVLMISALAATIVQAVVQRIFMVRSDYKYHFVFNIKAPEMLKTLALIWPVFFSSCISDINKLIDKALASTLTAGALSSLTYSSKINTLFLGIFITAVTTVIFPLFSKAATANDNNKTFKSLICHGINTVLAVAVPSAIALMSVGILVVQILYQRGSFTMDNTRMVNDALFYYAMALPGMSVRLVSVKAFYSMQDTKTPVINGSICIAVNVVLNIVLKQIMGYTGLALATAIASNLLAIVLLITLYKKVNGYDARFVLITFAKILVSSIVMGVCAFALYQLVFQSMAVTFITRVVSLGIIAVASVCVYVVMCYILKISVVTELIGSFVGKFKKRSLSR